MKKIVFFTLFIFVAIISSLIYATNVNPNNGYEFNLEYEGTIVVNEPKDGVVTLTGTSGTPYANVRVEAKQLSGPATATVYAYEENGNKIDITNENAWGPPSGFAVGGTFTNETRITAIYPHAGTYVTRLSLIDLNNSNAVITSKDFTVTVIDETKPENNVINNIVNNSIQNNIITQIPQTGVSIWTYLFVLVGIIAEILLIRKFIIKEK